MPGHVANRRNRRVLETVSDTLDAMIPLPAPIEGTKKQVQDPPFERLNGHLKPIASIEHLWRLLKTY